MLMTGGCEKEKASDEADAQGAEKIPGVLKGYDDLQKERKRSCGAGVNLKREV